MVSLKDISAACGVSVATVSKALNGHKDVGQETRERIRKVAMELGYMPNAAAKALKTNRSYNLGILFVDESQSGLTHDYYAALLDSFKKEAELQGYDLTFINSNSQRQNRMSYLAHSRYRGFDGVCIACVNFYDPEIMELVRSDIPIVTIDHVFNNRMVIQSDNVQGMTDLLNYIIGKGHRRIAFIHGTDSAVTQNRLSAFYKTCYENGITEIPEEYVQEAPYRDMNKTAKLTEYLLDLPVRPTCILYPDDLACVGGLNTLMDMGLRIPEDVSIAGYDGIPLAHLLRPKLTTVLQDGQAAGRAAGQELLRLIRSPRDFTPQHIVMPCTLIPGDSVGEI